MQRRWLIGIAITVTFGVFGAVMAVLAYTRSTPTPTPARGPVTAPAVKAPAAPKPDRPAPNEDRGGKDRDRDGDKDGDRRK